MSPREERPLRWIELGFSMPVLLSRTIRQTRSRENGVSYGRTPDRPADGVPQSRSDRVVRAFAHRFRPEGSEIVAGVGEVHLGGGDVGHLWNPVGAEHRIDDGAVRSDHHLLVQGAADGLGHTAFHLAAALFGVQYGAGIGGLDGLQDADLAGPDVDGDPERLHVEGEGPQFAELIAVARSVRCRARARPGRSR